MRRPTMTHDPSLVPGVTPIVLVTAETEERYPDVRVAATRDHDVIQRWASQHKAEPATGERTASGDSTVDVNDGDAGIRFNFPAVGRFRPITWDEWFGNFEQYDLVFVYERETAGVSRSYRYRLVTQESLQAGPALL
jgi:hypothetical protein